MSDHIITLAEGDDDSEARAIVAGLVAFNSSRAEPANHQRVILLLRDSERSLQGGLVGYTHWGWLFVSHLWIAEPARGLGLGRALMKAAEEEALRRGCQHAHLDTHGFQARGFYERLGYEVFGQLDDYPSGHARYFLRKRLAPERLDTEALKGSP